MLKNILLKKKHSLLLGMLVTTVAMAGTTHGLLPLDKSSESVSNSSDFSVDMKTGNVINKKDGLVWAKCLVGQSYLNGQCSGTPTKFTNWQSALDEAKKHAKDGWRLPSIKELVRITDSNRAYPAIDMQTFTFASTPTFYGVYQADENDQLTGGAEYLWSSTPVSQTSSKELGKEAKQAYALDLSYGTLRKVNTDGSKFNDKSAGTDVGVASYILLVKDAS